MMDERTRAMLLPLTLPLSWVYGAAVRLRNRRYDSGEGVARLPVGVVSVGNLTVGGTGKTPLVRALARELVAAGAPVAIVSRGYGRRDRSPFVLVSDGKDVLASVEEAGDEPMELALALAGVAVGVGADRYDVARRLLDTVGPRVVLLDDGFQHRRLHRDLDLVCFDAGEPLSSLRVLPAGRLREPLAGLARAHGLVWTGADEAAPDEALAGRLRRAGGADLAVLHARRRVAGFAPVGGRAGAETLPSGAFEGVDVGLMAGMARPERMLAEARYRPVVKRFAPDHHWWRAEEVRELAAEAKARGAEAVLTTGKDAVKLAPLLEAGALRLPLPIFVVRIEVELADRAALRALLERVPES